MTPQTCSILQREFPAEELTPLSAIRPKVAMLIRRGHPQLGDESLISTSALAPFRAEYVRSVLEEASASFPIWSTMWWKVCASTNSWHRMWRRNLKPI